VLALRASDRVGAGTTPGLPGGGHFVVDLCGDTGQLGVVCGVNCDLVLPVFPTNTYQRLNSFICTGGCRVWTTFALLHWGDA